MLMKRIDFPGAKSARRRALGVQSETGGVGPLSALPMCGGAETARGRAQPPSFSLNHLAPSKCERPFFFERCARLVTRIRPSLANTARRPRRPRLPASGTSDCCGRRMQSCLEYHQQHHHPQGSPHVTYRHYSPQSSSPPHNIKEEEPSGALTTPASGSGGPTVSSGGGASMDPRTATCPHPRREMLCPGSECSEDPRPACTR
ncbi:hypothetical protein CEXT_317271 [Caerostris extrusa]|uniref:Uncharacterized protein n=1 Tax=Caerostris extrusa TaxID=172846 RepID=A0AAV4WXG1_CAEEX|nr:hypothetical protein CEXT_317271 [Caerostris extrusa]